MSAGSDNFVYGFFLGELNNAAAGLHRCLERGFATAEALDILSGLKSAANMASLKNCAGILEHIILQISGLSRFNGVAAEACAAAVDKLASYFSDSADSSGVPEVDLRLSAPDFEALFSAGGPDVKTSSGEGGQSSLEKEGNPNGTLANAASKGVNASAEGMEEKTNPAAGLAPSASMFELFLTEAENQAEALESLAMGLEGDFKNPRKLEALMRASHSLKGAARVVSLTPLVELMHLAESCFVAAQENKITLNSDSLDVVFACADFLKESLAEKFLNPDLSKIAALSEDLKNIADGTFSPERRRSEKGDSAGIAEGNKKNTKETDGAVRVSAASLTRMMSLSAEGMVENLRLEAQKESLVSMKESARELIRRIEASLYSAESSTGAGGSNANLESARQIAQDLLSSLQSQLVMLGEFSRRSVLISGGLYSEVIASRMRPLAEGLQSFPRMVRDLGRSLGKKISLSIEGRNVPVDRDIMERLDAPIGHILRNACDHGIELPSVRVAAGKNPTGEIKIKAWHSAGSLMLRISDDGAGIDPELVRDKIKEGNLASAEMLSQMTNEEILEFLFLPNFSTKNSVTSVSGRGVGLDVVRTVMEEVGGSVRIFSRPGEGTVFLLKLPITRSVLRALCVRIDSQAYAIALNRLYRLVRISAKDVGTADNRSYFELEGRRVWLVDAARALGFEASERNESDGITALVIADKKNLYALETGPDVLECDLVVRPLSERFGKIYCVQASALSESGEPVLILDVDDLISSIGKLLSGGAGTENPRATTLNTASERKKKVLVVDDSLTVRETERQILEAGGYSVEVAVDGMDGWNAVRLGNFDLVVTDVDMPRMSGFELARHMRGNARLKNIPIVAVSYKDRPEDRRQGTASGVDCYLTKSSFQNDTFLDTVARLIKEAKR